MKHRAFYLMAAATTMLASPAFSAPVFMLQFGSFETREEAQSRLNAVKAEHGGVINNLQAGIREVTLPPDNLVVYRTQAGPLSTRAQAQSACSQLASNGDECYVVETAAMPEFAPSTTQVATAAAAPQAVPMPLPMSSATQPARDSSTESPTAIMNAMPTPMPTAIAPSTTAPDAQPPIALAPIPARDPNNVAMINSVSPKKADAAPMAMATAQPPVTAASAAPSSMAKAMDEAAKEQSARESGIESAPTPPGAKQEGSFWSRMNPFGGEAQPAKAPAPKPLALAAAPATEAPAPMPAAMPAPQAIPAPALTPLPSGMDNTKVITQAPMVQLPPPPAPLIGKGAITPGNSTAASLRAPAPAPVVVPEATGNVPPPILIADAPNGNVRVGEAQRVPLSQNTLPSAAPAVAPAPSMLMPGAPAVNLHPSATLGQKTLWAHIGPFTDAQAALSFWDQYRRSNPDFPVVRVRVSSPMQNLQHGNENVALRVGPFGKQSSIRTLCATVPADRLKCGEVTDIGIAAPINGGKSGYLSGSRYRR